MMVTQHRIQYRHYPYFHVKNMHYCTFNNWLNNYCTPLAVFNVSVITFRLILSCA